MLYLIAHHGKIRFIEADNIKTAFDIFCKDNKLKAQILKITDPDDPCLWANTEAGKRICIQRA